MEFLENSPLKERTQNQQNVFQLPLLTVSAFQVLQVQWDAQESWSDLESISI